MWELGLGKMLMNAKMALWIRTKISFTHKHVKLLEGLPREQLVLIFAGLTLEPIPLVPTKSFDVKANGMENIYSGSPTMFPKPKRAIPDCCSSNARVSLPNKGRSQTLSTRHCAFEEAAY